MTRRGAKLNIDDEPEKPENWKDASRVESVELTPDDELDDVLADFPQNDACIELFRVNAQGGRPAFLEQMMPSAFSFGYVTERFGGGRYLAKGKYANGTKKKMSFEIEGDPIPIRRKFVNIDPQAPVLPNRPQSIEVERIPPTGSDGQDFQAALMAMMGKMMQQTQSSEMQILEKMKMYKDLFGSPAQKEAPLEVALSMFQKGVEMAGVGGGGGDSQSFWLMAIRELKDPLLKIVETVQTAIAKPQPVHINPRNSPATVSTPETPNPPLNEDPMLALMPVIKQMLPALVNGASKNSDPSLYVDFLLDQIPASAYPSFRDWLLKPGCLDQLAMLEPGVRFQREWWEALRATLLDAINEELNGPPIVQPSTVDQSPTVDAGDHEELS